MKSQHPIVYIVLGLALLTTFAIWIVIFTPTPPQVLLDNGTQTKISAFPDEEESDIFLLEPGTTTLITSPVQIRGSARGFWFFEGSFPISLTDAHGRILGKGIAHADGEWMTNDLVPFSATIPFLPSSTATGTLIITKDNPSGLPENDQKYGTLIHFPISSPSDRVVTVKTFFEAPSSNLDTDCVTVTPIVRTSPYTKDVARRALEELFLGPTADERASGIRTSLNPGISIHSLTITSGVAVVDLSAELDAGVSGSCRVTTIRNQITQTLLQFPTITSVTISSEGRTDDILQP